MVMLEQFVELTRNDYKQNWKTFQGLLLQFSKFKLYELTEKSLIYKCCYKLYNNPY